jgi:hypothetical protein
VALWALGFVRASVPERTGGCGSGSSLTLNERHIDDYAIFELAIRAFDIQRRWRDAFERQREYKRRDLFMGKLNPEKFSQRLEELNKYLDYALIEKIDPKRMAY